VEVQAQAAQFNAPLAASLRKLRRDKQVEGSGMLGNGNMGKVNDNPLRDKAMNMTATHTHINRIS